MSLNRCQVDDRPAATFLHLWNPKMSQQIDAGDVHHHASVPAFEIGFYHRAKGMKSRGVHDHIQTAEFVRSLRNHGLHRLGLSNATFLYAGT